MPALGLVTYNWGKTWDLPTLLNNCAETGFQGVELRSTHAHGVEPDIDAAARRAVAQEWIPGPPDRFAKLYVMCDQRSRVVAHHTLRRLRVHVRQDGSQGDTLIAKTERVSRLIGRKTAGRNTGKIEWLNHWVKIRNRVFSLTC